MRKNYSEPKCELCGKEEKELTLQKSDFGERWACKACAKPRERSAMQDSKNMKKAVPGYLRIKAGMENRK